MHARPREKLPRLGKPLLDFAFLVGFEPERELIEVVRRGVAGVETDTLATVQHVHSADKIQYGSLVDLGTVIAIDATDADVACRLALRAETLHEKWLKRHKQQERRPHGHCARDQSLRRFYTVLTSSSQSSLQTVAASA